MIRKIIVDSDLSDDIVLWRYMNLEKFINLVDTCTLFLSPISFFQKSDPLEGHLPKKFHEIMEYSFKSMWEEQTALLQNLPDEMQAGLKDFSETSKIRLNLMREKARGRQSICCWYESQLESEAMWKLYGDNGKSLAIKTTVGALKRAIESQSNEKQVFLSRIKYLDFNDSDLKEVEVFPKTQKPANILLKRKEYEHEKEIRLYHQPDTHDLLNPQRAVFNDYWEKYVVSPHYINVDIDELIDSIVISPYVYEPYLASVKAICSKYQIKNCKIYQSTLLEGYDIKPFK